MSVSLPRMKPTSTADPAAMIDLEGTLDPWVFCRGSKTSSSTLGIFTKAVGVSGAGKL